MTQPYPGSELEHFAMARNWKRYVAATLAPFIGERVLEIGAGLGANILYLHHPRVRDWLCLEPDPEMARGLAAAITAGSLPAECRVIPAGIAALGVARRFDSVLYLDVLEHIADDCAELARATQFLSPGGALVVLAPAHPFLFSPFDAAIGHHRRYTRASLLAAAPPGLRLRRLRMLDSVGFFASFANRLVLKSSRPSSVEIALWDRVMVPLSRVFDPLLGYRFGKSVLAVWTAAP
jgi:SAM-dependent methyltransferase